MPNYDLFAFDLDGTLLDASGRIPKDALAFVHELARTAHVTVATGRSLPSSRYYLEELAVRIPAVLYHGAAVWDPLEERTLRTRRIPPELAHRLLEKTAHLPVDVQVYRSVDDPTVYVKAMSPRVQAFARQERLTMSEKDDWTEILASGVLKILCITDPDRVPDVEVALREAVPELTVVHSAQAYLEILPPNTTKGDALAWLCSELGIPLSRVVAVGDQMSDRTMLERAGLGVAMEAAPAGLKGVAQLVVPTIPALQSLLER